MRDLVYIISSSQNESVDYRTSLSGNIIFVSVLTSPVLRVFHCVCVCVFISRVSIPFQAQVQGQPRPAIANTTTSAPSAPPPSGGASAPSPYAGLYPNLQDEYMGLNLVPFRSTVTVSLYFNPSHMHT